MCKHLSIIWCSEASDGVCNNQLATQCERHKTRSKLAPSCNCLEARSTAATVPALCDVVEHAWIPVETGIEEAQHGFLRGDALIIDLRDDGSDNRARGGRAVDDLSYAIDYCDIVGAIRSDVGKAASRLRVVVLCRSWVTYWSDWE